MRRLFSSFARGWPGVALLLMRLVAATALFEQSVVDLDGSASTKTLALALLAIVAAGLLLSGLWTPLAGSVAALLELWSLLLHFRDPWTYVLLGTFGLCLAMLGPGAWSVDAYLFGWKRIDIGHRPS